jgi:hypothetical protein
MRHVTLRVPGRRCADHQELGGSPIETGRHSISNRRTVRSVSGRTALPNRRDAGHLWLEGEESSMLRERTNLIDSFE